MAATPSQIADDVVVSLAYTLRSDSGEVLDQADGSDPLVYLHGHDNLLPAFEANLLGLTVGAKHAFTLSPEDGYGVRDDKDVQEIERKHLPPGMELEVDEELVIDFGMGPRPYRVIKLTAETFTIDRNHPLAGETLHFEIEVVALRAAEAEEIDHGHVHMPGHHHH